jgi:hypothetical protein
LKISVYNFRKEEKERWRSRTLLHISIFMESHVYAIIVESLFLVIIMRELMVSMYAMLVNQTLIKSFTFSEPDK